MPPLQSAVSEPQRILATARQKGFLLQAGDPAAAGAPQRPASAGPRAPLPRMPAPPAAPSPAPAPAAEGDLLRCMAGLRALLALMCMLRLLSVGAPPAPGLPAALLVASLYAAGLLWMVTRGAPGAGSGLWHWVDSALLLWLGQLDPPAPSLFTVLLVVPVVLATLQQGIAHGFTLACASGLALLWITGQGQAAAGLSWQTLLFPAGLLALGPAAAMLVRPEQAQRQRRALLDELARRTTPRHGLAATVDVLLEVFAAHTRCGTVLLSLSGPQPRVFARCPNRAGVQALPPPEADALREWLRTLPSGQAAWLRPASPTGLEARALALDGGQAGGALVLTPEVARGLQRAIGPGAVVLPLVSYGQAHGHLVVGGLKRRHSVAMWRQWQAMAQEALPLVERADLLEQLENEAAAHERARIGRDLHDSAVQPYLGLKYGIEALLRRTAPDNPVAGDVRGLLEMASAELEGLRELVSGLRSGHRPRNGEDPLRPALERQARRLRTLFGINVAVRVAEVPALRRSLAQALFHMVNEALNNARRHTQARHVEIELQVVDGQLRLSVCNDHGTAPAAPRRFHPRSLSERAQALGGRVEVHERPGQTDVVITVPLDHNTPMH